MAPRRPSKFRRGVWFLVRLVFAIVLLALAVAAGAVSYLTQSDRGRDILRLTAVDWLNGNLMTGEIAIDRVDGPILGRVVVQGVTISDEEGFRAVELPWLRVDYRLLPLFGGEIVIERVHLYEPQVAGRIRRDGTLNLADLVLPSDEPSEEAAPPDLRLEELRVRTGAMELRDLATADARLVVVRDFATDARVEMQPDGTISGAVDEIFARFAVGGLLDVTLPVRGSHITATMEGDAVRGAIGELSVGGVLLSNVEARATLAPSSDAPFETISVTAPRLEVDPATVRAVAPNVPLKKRLLLEFSASGPAERMEIRALVRGAAERVRLSGELDVSDPLDIGYRLELLTLRFEPQKWFRLPGLEADVSVRLTAEGRGIRPADAQASVRADIGPSRVNGVGIEEALAVLRYDAGDLAVPQLLIRAAYTEADASAAWSPSSGDATLSLSLDANDLAVFAPLLGPDATLVGSAKATVEASGQLSSEELASYEFTEPAVDAVDMLRRFDLQTEVELDGIGYDGFALTRGRVQAASRRGEHADVDVRVDATRLQAPGSPAIDLRLRARLERDELSLDLSSAAPAYDAEIATRVIATYADRTIDAQIADLVLAAQGSALASTRPATARIRLGGPFELLDVRLSGLRMRGFGGHVGADLFATAEGRFDATVEVDSLSVADLVAAAGVEGAGAVTGGLGMLVEASGTAADPDVEARLTLRRTGIEGLPPVDADIALRYETGRLQGEGVVDRYGVSVPEAATDEPAPDAGDGEEPPDDEPTDESTDEPTDEPTSESRTPERWTTPEVEGWIELSMDLPVDHGLVGQQAVPLRRDAPMSLSLVMQDTELAPICERHPACEPYALGGIARLSAQLGGTAVTPTATADVSWNDGRLLGLSALGLEFEARLTPSALVAIVALDHEGVERIALHSELPTTVNLAAGTVRVREDDELSVALTADAIDLSLAGTLAPELAEYEPSGTLSADIAVAGSSRAPRLEGAVSVDGLGAKLPLGEDGWRLDQVSAGIELEYDGTGPGPASGLVVVETDWGGSPLFAASAELGDLPSVADALDGVALQRVAQVRANAVAELKSLPLERLPLAALGLSGEATGELGIRLHWQGTGRSGDLEAGLTLREIRFEQFSPVELDASLRIGDRRTEFQLESAYGDAPLATIRGYAEDGLIGLMQPEQRRDPDVALDLRIHEFPLSHLGVFDDRWVSSEGSVRGFVEVSGTMMSPTLISRLAARDIELFDGTSGLVGAELGYQSQRLTTSAFICDGTGYVIQADAAVRLPQNPMLGLIAGVEIAPPTEWPFEIRVAADESPLASFVPRKLVAGLIDDVAGELDIDLSVSGTLDDPTADGTLVVRDGAASLIQLGRALDDVDVDIGLTHERVDVRQLSIRDGTGRAQVGGYVELNEELIPSELDFDLELRDFLVGSPGTAGVFVDAKIGVDGQLEGDRLETAIVIRDSTINVPEDVTSNSFGPTSLPDNVLIVGRDVAADQVGQKNPRPLGEEASVPTETPVILSISIDTAGENEIRHTYAQIRYTVDLEVELNGPELFAQGVVELPEGTVRFAGKQFELSEGRVLFSRGEDIGEPRLDIRAVHYLSPQVASNLDPATSGRAAIFVDVTGTAAQPDVRLHSDPEMTEEDVLFVLLTGRPRTSSESAAEQTSAGAQALATAGSLFVGLLSDRMSGNLPLDTIRVESDAQSGEVVSRVEGGKYVAEDVYLSGAYIPGAEEGENSFELALEWIIRRVGPGTLRLALSGGDAAAGSLELLYNFFVQ